MGKLIYSMNVSLDGFVETVDHGLDWIRMDDELHAWFNDQEAAATAFLYGRGMYDLMSGYWPTAGSDPAATGAVLDYARIWLAKPKYVFSNSLETVEWNSTLVRGDVGPEAERLKRELDGELGVGGATLAAELIRLGLVDEFRPVIHPVILGEGTPFLPALDRPLELDLVDTRRFDSGAVALTYRAKAP